MLERGSWGGFERGYAATLPPFILTHPSLSPSLEETVFDQCPPLQDHSTTHTLKSEGERGLSGETLLLALPGYNCEIWGLSHLAEPGLGLHGGAASHRHKPPTARAVHPLT